MLEIFFSNEYKIEIPNEMISDLDILTNPRGRLTCMFLIEYDSLDSAMNYLKTLISNIEFGAEVTKLIVSGNEFTLENNRITVCVTKKDGKIYLKCNVN